MYVCMYVCMCMTHVCMYVYLARYRMESSRPTHTHCHVDPFGTRGVWSAQDLESFIAAWQLPTVRTRRMMDIAAMHRTPRIGYDGDAEARYGQCLSVAPSRAIGSSSPLWSPGHVSKLEHIGEHP
jgi:hypothetical protein